MSLKHPQSVGGVSCDVTNFLLRNKQIWLQWRMIWSGNRVSVEFFRGKHTSRDEKLPCCRTREKEVGIGRGLLLTGLSADLFSRGEGRRHRSWFVVVQQDSDVV